MGLDIDAELVTLARDAARAAGSATAARLSYHTADMLDEKELGTHMASATCVNLYLIAQAMVSAPTPQLRRAGKVARRLGPSCARARCTWW